MNKKKFLALFLAVCMLLSMLPTAAFANEPGDTPAPTNNETVVCTKADGCPAETHEEGCPKYVVASDEPSDPSEDQVDGVDLNEDEGQSDEDLDLTADAPEEENSDPAPAGIDWTADEITITTVDELKEFAQRVNSAYVTTAEDFLGALTGGGDITLGGDIDLSGGATPSENPPKPMTFEGQTVTLGADLDLTGEAWTPIGTAANPFKGTFDGAGHTISNLTVNEASSADAAPAGLFGCVINAEIKNLTVEGTVNGQYYVGGIAGAAVNSTISNCTNNANVQATGYAAGIVGVTHNTDVTNCSNTGTVSGSNNSLAGIVGEARYGGAISNNTNSGAVSTSAQGYGIGGIVGWVRYLTDNSIKDSLNGVEASPVEITGNNNTGDVSSALHAGGVVGEVYSAAVVTGNTNEGAVTGGTGNDAAAGGVVGYIHSATAKPANAAVTVTGNTVAENQPELGVTVDGDKANGVTVTTDSNAVAEVGGVKYSSLQAAINAANVKGDTITMLKDYTVPADPGGIRIWDDIKNLVLDLNGKTVHGAIWNYGTLTITGNGRVDNTSNENGWPAVENYGKLTVENGTYTAKDGTYALIGYNSDSDIMIKGGTFRGVGNAGGKITVEDGTFNAHDTVEGALIAALINWSNEVIIKGGTYTTAVGCDATTIENDDKMTIEGGTIQNLNQGHGCIAAQDPQDDDGNVIGKGVLTITGGSFAGLIDNWNYAAPEISGGSFNSDVSAYVVPTAVQAGNTVRPRTESDTDAVAKIGNDVYASLQAAITAAGNDGDTVTVLKDTAEAVTLPLKSITLTSEGETKPVLTGKVDFAAGAMPEGAEVTIENLAFEKTSIRMTAWTQTTNLEKMGGLTIRNNTFTGSAAGAGNISAIHINNNDGAVNNLTITGNVFDGCGTNAGSCVYATTCGKLVVTGNTFKNSAFNALTLTGKQGAKYGTAKTTSATISGNVFDGWASTYVNGDTHQSEGRAMRLSDFDCDVDLTENSFTSTKIPEEFVKYSGIGEGATVNVNNCYWGAATEPTFGKGAGKHVYDNVTAEEKPENCALDAYYTDEEMTNLALMENSGAVAQVGTMYYTTLAEAVAALEDGDTLTILKDCGPTANEQMRITKNNVTIQGQKAEDGTVPTIDCGEFSCSGQAGILVSGDNVTVKDLKVTTALKNVDAIKVTKVGADALVKNVTLENLELTHTGDADHKGNGLNVHGADQVTIKNVKASGLKCGLSLANAMNVTVSESNLTGGWGSIGMMFDTKNPSNPAYANPVTLTLGEGNTYTGVIYSERSTENKDTVTLAANQTANIAGALVMNNDKLTTEMPAMVEQATGVIYYATLQSAIDATQTGTVKLLKNTTEKITVAAGKNITLELVGNSTLNGPVLEYVSNTNKTGSSLTNNGTLTITGSGTITRDETGVTDHKGHDYVILNNGALTIEGNVNIVGTCGREGNPPSVICNGPKSDATLTITGGTVKSVGSGIAVKNDEFGILKIFGTAVVTTEGTTFAAVQNWNDAAIIDGIINGNVETWTYLATTAYTGLSGEVTVNGEVTDNLYGEEYGYPKPTNAPLVEVKGGTYSTNVSKYCLNNTAAYQDASGNWTIKSAAGTVSSSAGLTVDSTDPKNITVTIGSGCVLSFDEAANKWYTNIVVTAPDKTGAENVTIRAEATPAELAKGTLETIHELDWNSDKTTDQTVTVKIVEGVGFAQEGMVAAVNGIQYPTLAEAVADAADKAEVQLLQNASGSGIIVNKNITINFGGFTYTVAKAPLAGSGEKYATQAFQLLAGADKANPNTVKMVNGTIVLPAETDNLKMGIQNYTNLTLDKMTIDASGNSNITYVLSNNNGSTKLTGGTVIKAAEGKVAFDVYDYSSNGYGNVSVTVDNADVTGKIEVSETEKAKLEISGGKFDTDVSKYVVAGNGWNSETGTVAALTVTLDRTALSMTVGYTTSAPVPLTASTNVTPADGTVTWTSSNTAVATVDGNGVVTPVGVGTAAITATVSGVTSAACTVTVTRTTAPYVPPVTEPDEDLDEPDTPLVERPWLFTDVTEADGWIYASVKDLYDRNLINGLTDTIFGSGDLINRGQLAAILWRAAGEPEVTGENTYEDVAADAYYAKAILWATQNNIVAGYNAQFFGPNDSIRRQDLVVMLYRFAVLQGLEQTATGDLSVFTDQESVSKYAMDAMAWAVDAGVLKGVGGNKLNPRGNATRAEACAFLSRFLPMIEEDGEKITA